MITRQVGISRLEEGLDVISEHDKRVVPSEVHCQTCYHPFAVGSDA